MYAPRPPRLASLAIVLGLALVVPSAAFAAAPARTLEGTLVVAHGDSFAGNAANSRSIFYDTLVTDSGEVSLTFNGKRPAGFFNGARVRITGAMASGRLQVGPSRGDTKILAAAVAATDERRVAVLLVKFAASQAEPYTRAQARATNFTAPNSVAAYFAEQSYGLMTMTGDVFGPYAISINTSQCDYTDIGNKARAAATAAGVNLNGYSQIQYVHTPLESCAWSGLAYVPGRDSWINGALNLQVSAHELSHNFGVHHASAMSCSEGGVRVTLSATASNCSSNEYGDPFSIMGAASTRHTHNQHLASAGWITGPSLQTIDSPGTYAIAAAEDPQAPAPRGVRIPRGNGTWFYLELRRPYGLYFDTYAQTDPAVNGVSIRMSDDWTTIIQSQLLDATPATSSFLDAALAPGQSFIDPLSGVRVTTVSVADGVATVDVGWGAASSPPSSPGNPAVAATGASAARFSWSAASDNDGVTGYRVSRDGAVLGTVAGTRFDDTGLIALVTYEYSVVALDAAGNASGAASTSFTMPDRTAPTAPSSPRTTTVNNTKVKLAWKASFDTVGVAGYRIYRNGNLAGTTTALAWSQSRPPNRKTFWVVAFDAAGNVSGRSKSLKVAAR